MQPCSVCLCVSVDYWSVVRSGQSHRNVLPSPSISNLVTRYSLWMIYNHATMDKMRPKLSKENALVLSMIHIHCSAYFCFQIYSLLFIIINTVHTSYTYIIYSASSQPQLAGPWTFCLIQFIYRSQLIFLHYIRSKLGTSFMKAKAAPPRPYISASINVNIIPVVIPLVYQSVPRLILNYTLPSLLLYDLA